MWIVAFISACVVGMVMLFGSFIYQHYKRSWYALPAEQRSQIPPIIGIIGGAILLIALIVGNVVAYYTS